MVLESKYMGGGEEEGGKAGAETREDVCRTGPRGRRREAAGNSLQRLRLRAAGPSSPGLVPHQPASLTSAAAEPHSGVSRLAGVGVGAGVLSCRGKLGKLFLFPDLF